MDLSQHDLAGLFQQLGLDDGAEAIDRFIAEHQLPNHCPIEQAPFWDHAQASFLAESINQDADWAEAVDHLSVMLRG